MKKKTSSLDPPVYQRLPSPTRSRRMMVNAREYLCLLQKKHSVGKSIEIKHYPHHD